MKIRLSFAPILFLAVLAPLLPAQSLRHYQIEIAARSGDVGTTGFSRLVSVNSSGDVAFVGLVPTGEQIMIARPGAAAVAVNPGFIGPTRSFQGSVSLNDAASIGARDRVSGSPPSGFLRLWDTTLANANTVYLRAGTAQAYDGFVSSPSLNNNGQIAVATFRDPTTRLTLSDALGLVGETAVNEPIRPALSDSGLIVIRRLGELVLYANATAQLTTIAGTAQFSAMGIAPDISESGVVLAFSGVPTASGALAYGGVTGAPGAYVVVREGATNRTLKLDTTMLEQSASFSLTHDSDGLCDAGEPCDFSYAGYDALGPIELLVDTNARMKVIQQPFGEAGLAGDSIVALFLATPNRGELWSHGFRAMQKAAWMVRVDVLAGPNSLKYRASRPVVVLQVGDTVDSAQITDLDVFESLARSSMTSGAPRVEARADHRIGLWVNTSAGQRIVRATHHDADEDGLPDHWETAGIDADANGTIDLALHQPPFNANATLKEVFLEVDSLSASFGSTTPLAESLTAAAAAFAGLNPPVQLKPAVADMFSDQIVTAGTGDVISWVGGAGVDDDFNDYKRGSARTQSSACGAGASGRLGNPADRSSPNCPAILLARSMAFRYVLFARGYSEMPDSSGVSEVLGDDLMVTVRGWNFSSWGVKTCRSSPFGCVSAGAVQQSGRFELEAATLAHELGHALNLRHGGQDDVNCKPNYFSVMNYAFQFPHLGHRPKGFALTLPVVQLDERSIVENGGVGSFPSGWTHTFRKHPMNGWEPQFVAQPIDFNRDTIFSSTAQSIDLNSGAIAGCDGVNESFVGPLRVQSDTQSMVLDLVFSSGKAIASGLGTLGQQLPAQLERTSSEVLSADTGLDPDLDGVNSPVDNCPFDANPNQLDANGNGVGDVCESPSSDLFRNGFE